MANNGGAAPQWKALVCVGGGGKKNAEKSLVGKKKGAVFYFALSELQPNQIEVGEK